MSSKYLTVTKHTKPIGLVTLSVSHSQKKSDFRQLSVESYASMNFYNRIILLLPSSEHDITVQAKQTK